MESAIARIEASIPGPLLPFRRRLFDFSGRQDVQRRYQEAEATLAFNNAIQGAGDIEALAGAVWRTPLDLRPIGTSQEDLARDLRALAEGGGNGLQNLPLAFFIRQKVRDLLEQRYAAHYQRQAADPRRRFMPPTPSDPVLRRGLAPLDEMQAGIFDDIRSMKKIRGRSKRYTPEETEELVYQVLERMNRPLAFITQHGEGLREKALAYMEAVVATARRLFPGDMADAYDGGRNPFTGERIDEHIETVYRYAKMVLNAHAGRPPFGYPTAGERRSVVEMVNSFFPKDRASTYAEAQAILRRHIEAGTPELGIFMKRADANAKLLALEAYFGNFSHRQMPGVGVGMRVARTLGEMGVYREVGVTITRQYGRLYVNLSLGDMHSMSNESHGHYYILHTHPETYLTDRGDWMGENRNAPERAVATIYVTDRRIDTSTLNVLFSRQDLHVMRRDAERYFRDDAALGERSWYDSKVRTYRSWLVHPYGMALMEVVLDHSGSAKNVKIVFGVKTDADAGVRLDQEYRHSRKKLSHEAQAMGLPIEFEHVPYQQIASEYPY